MELPKRLLLAVRINSNSSDVDGAMVVLVWCGCMRCLVGRYLSENFQSSFSVPLISLSIPKGKRTQDRHQHHEEKSSEKEVQAEKRPRTQQRERDFRKDQYQDQGKEGAERKKDIAKRRSPERKAAKEKDVFPRYVFN